MIKHTPPPNYKEIRKHFPNADFNNKIVFTYFPDIYIKGHPREDILVHEVTHIKQQKEMTPQIWWAKYFKDKKFRMQQEVEAYHNQYENNPGMLQKLAMDMSSPLYKFGITYEQARSLIKNG